MNRVEKPVNFRDLGGIQTRDGRTVRAHKLLRCGDLINLTEEEKKKLTEEYELTAIIDLRTKSEIEKGADTEIEGVSYTAIDVLDNAMGQTGTPEDFMSKVTLTDVEDMMKMIYRRFVEDEVVRTGYQTFMKLICEQQEGAVLFHCSAGKDRTGIGAAIILYMLGVSEDDIVKDYLETNRLRQEENAMFMQMAKAEGMPPEGLEALEGAMCVKESYLKEAMEAAREHYGSFENYIRTGLQVTDAMINTMKEKYLE